MRSIIGTILLLSLTLLALEGVSRSILWAPTGYTDTGTPRQGFSAESIGDWTPNQDAVWIDKLQHPFYVHINKDGFRNIDEIDLSARKVLVLGDSQTFGLFVSSHDIWTRTAQRLLNKQKADRVQLLNTGLPGSTIIDHLAYLREKAIFLRPDVVLLSVYQNDVADLSLSETSFGPSRENKRKHAKDAVSNNYAFRRILNDNFAAYSLAREVKDFLLRRNALDEVMSIRKNDKRRSLPPITPLKAESDNSVYKKKYENLFEQAIIEIKKINARGIVIYIPSGEECNEGLETINLSEELAKRHQIPFLDLSADLCTREVAEVFLFDPVRDGQLYAADSHLSRYGHITIGRAVAKFLESALKE